MNKHRQVLAAMVDELIVLDSNCSIILGGSMGRNEECKDSDIDLFVFFSKEPQHFTNLIGQGNRDRWHTYTEREGITIDIGWNLLDSLPDQIPESTEMVPYVFVRAKIVRDPSGKVDRWIQAMRRWLDCNQWVDELWGKQYEEMRRHKKDPSYRLEYDEHAFLSYLRELVAQRKKMSLQQTNARAGE